MVVIVDDGGMQEHCGQQDMDEVMRKQSYVR